MRGQKKAEEFLPPFRRKVFSKLFLINVSWKFIGLANFSVWLHNSVNKGVFDQLFQQFSGRLHIHSTGAASICSHHQFADPRRQIHTRQLYGQAHVPEMQLCCVGHKEMQLGLPQEMLP